MLSSSQSLPLQLEKVCYEVNGITLIRDIDLKICSTGTTIILGHNGAGKSLLLKLLHGVILPSSGTIKWNNHTPSPNQFWRTFLLQKPTFFQQSVLYNIEFVLRVAGIPAKQHKSRSLHALETCGLTNFVSRNTHSLSGGELQKLSLARAWVLEPSIVLLDEPTVALDPPSVQGFEDIIQQFKQSGTKVIMTTHDLAQAKRLADEIVFIDSGKVIEQSSADIFFLQPQSSQAQNFIRGQRI